MATINDPTTPAQVQGVGMAAGNVWVPSHNAAGPLSIGAGGAYRISLSAGTMAASLAANAEIFQFRFVTAASRVCLVHRIRVSASVLTLPAISTAALPGGLGLNACVARAWTAAGSGGTRGVLTTNNAKLRTAHATSEVNDIGIATTAVLTVGTKTLDTANFGGVMANSPGVLTAVGAAGPSFIPSTDLLGDMGLSFPLVLANQEGFIIRNSILAFPVTMTWSFTVDVAWSEVTAF